MGSNDPLEPPNSVQGAYGKEGREGGKKEWKGVREEQKPSAFPFTGIIGLTLDGYVFFFLSFMTVFSPLLLYTLRK